MSNSARGYRTPLDSRVPVIIAPTLDHSQPRAARISSDSKGPVTIHPPTATHVRHMRAARQVHATVILPPAPADAKEQSSLMGSCWNAVTWGFGKVKSGAASLGQKLWGRCRKNPGSTFFGTTSCIVPVINAVVSVDPNAKTTIATYMQNNPDKSFFTAWNEWAKTLSTPQYFNLWQNLFCAAFINSFMGIIYLPLALEAIKDVINLIRNSKELTWAEVLIPFIAAFPIGGFAAVPTYIISFNGLFFVGGAWSGLPYLLAAINTLPYLCTRFRGAFAVSLRSIHLGKGRIFIRKESLIMMKQLSMNKQVHDGLESFLVSEELADTIAEKTRALRTEAKGELDVSKREALEKAIQDRAQQTIVESALQKMIAIAQQEKDAYLARTENTPDEKMMQKLRPHFHTSDEQSKLAEWKTITAEEKLLELHLMAKIDHFQIGSKRIPTYSLAMLRDVIIAGFVGVSIFPMFAQKGFEGGKYINAGPFFGIAGGSATGLFYFDTCLDLWDVMFTKTLFSKEWWQSCLKNPSKFFWFLAFIYINIPGGSSSKSVYQDMINSFLIHGMSYALFSNSNFYQGRMAEFLRDNSQSDATLVNMIALWRFLNTTAPTLKNPIYPFLLYTVPEDISLSAQLDTIRELLEKHKLPMLVKHGDSVYYFNNKLKKRLDPNIANFITFPEPDQSYPLAVADDRVYREVEAKDATMTRTTVKDIMLALEQAGLGRFIDTQKTLCAAATSVDFYVPAADDAKFSALEAGEVEREHSRVSVVRVPDVTMDGGTVRDYREEHGPHVLSMYRPVASLEAALVQPVAPPPNRSPSVSVQLGMWGGTPLDSAAASAPGAGNFKLDGAGYHRFEDAPTGARLG